MWRYIKDTNDRYKVYDDGTFKRLGKGNEWINIKPQKVGVGYYQVKIKENGVWKQFYAHRLVAEAFLGLSKRKDSFDIHHKDYDKSNNSLENLEIMTHKDNVRDYVENYEIKNGQKVRRTKRHVIGSHAMIAVQKSH